MTDCEQLIVDPFGKGPCANIAQSPLQIRLSQQTRAPVVAQQLFSDIENAAANKQALLDQQVEKLREKSEKISQLKQRKSEEFRELAARKAQEVETRLNEAEARRKAEEESRLQGLKEKHKKVEDVLNQKKNGSDTAESKEAIRQKLEAASERAKQSSDEKLAKANALNERVSTAQRRKWEFDAASQDTAQKLAERLADAENRRIAEEEAKLEKTRAMNQRVQDARAKRENGSPPHSPNVKKEATVESIAADLDSAQLNKQALLNKKTEELREKNAKVKMVADRKNGELEEITARMASEFEVRLEQAGARHLAGVEAKVEKTRAMNNRVSEAQQRKENSSDSSEMAQKLSDRLAGADAKRQAEAEAKLEKTRAMNNRVNEAEQRRNETASTSPSSPSHTEKMARAEARYLAEAEAKLDKTRAMNQRVEDAQARRAEAVDPAAKDAIHQKLVDAEARRLALQGETRERATTPNRANKVKAERDREVAELSSKLNERLSAADDRHAATIADNREKGASVARKAAQVASSQQDKEWQAREELSSGISAKLLKAEIRRDTASRESSVSKSNSCTPKKVSNPSSPGGVSNAGLLAEAPCDSEPTFGSV